jgi:hypothetical protein
MNESMFSALFTLAAAPVIDPCAPLPITVTPRGRQTLRAHDRPVPVVRLRVSVEAGCCPSLACRNMLLPGQSVCDECAAFAEAED